MTTKIVGNAELEEFNGRRENRQILVNTDAENVCVYTIKYSNHFYSV